MRNLSLGNSHELGCGTETSGFGVPRKQEENVKGVWSGIHQVVVKEKRSKGSRKEER